MKVVIRLSASDELKAIPILLRHSSGSILPDRNVRHRRSGGQCAAQGGRSFLGTEPRLERARAGRSRRL